MNEKKYMIQNKLNFFFKHQIWHIGGTIIFFYISAQFVDLNNNFIQFLKYSQDTLKFY